MASRVRPASVTRLSLEAASSSLRPESEVSISQLVKPTILPPFPSNPKPPEAATVSWNGRPPVNPHHPHPLADAHGVHVLLTSRTFTMWVWSQRQKSRPQICPS
ncbi:hypothetical protein CORC01_04422 [Colletotrichum orchidophilum]|uniref:Uncharacterized protein n=1 Tax=Colletotrichum orchidophilum TaxID=1209926 RepID=A0A1G4BG01_9PEZI|nr:uncharacterized protein CORC01_04422 [Colletotrichum orchidophilum]OHF00233.1 hypothetical protein CORC01_04422 [Colletotrichum orchidophilum]